MKEDFQIKELQINKSFKNKELCAEACKPWYIGYTQIIIRGIVHDVLLYSRISCTWLATENKKVPGSFNSNFCFTCKRGYTKIKMFVVLHIACFLNF